MTAGIIKKNELLRRWQKDVGDNYCNLIKTRYLPFDKNIKFKIFFNPRRAGSSNYGKGRKCLFCYLKRKKISFGEYFVIANIYPFTRNHRLIVSRKHYSQPKLRDLEMAVEISRLLNRTMILSLKDSGAGIPGHLHFHIYREKMPVFKAPEKFIAANKEISVSRIIFPSYGIVVAGDNLARWLYKITAKMIYPYNLVFYDRKILIYPRTKIFPVKNTSWKFGATELSGLFVVKTEKLFNQLTKKELCRCMKTATLNKSREISQFEKMIKQIVA
ncbi:MAG: DUF4922 domain-containing protein [Patescibacteria group bacterium]|jgi:hypothetical protein